MVESEGGDCYLFPGDESKCVWGALVRRDAALNPPPQTLAMLSAALQAQWLSLPTDLIDRIIDSITHRENNIDYSLDCCITVFDWMCFYCLHHMAVPEVLYICPEVDTISDHSCLPRQHWVFTVVEILPSSQDEGTERYELAAIIFISWGDMETEGSLCKFEAFWLTYFEWTVLLWVSCVTFNLFFNAVLLKRTEKYEWLYHAVCWGVPLIVASLPFMGDYYGPAGAWCWIKQEYTTWRLCIWYAPLVVIIVTLFIAYTAIHLHVKRKVKAWEGTYSPELERTKDVLKRDIRPLRLYPVIYLVLSIFPVINRVQNAVSEEPVFALTLLHTLFSPLPGAVNAIAFGLDRETVSRLSLTHIKSAFKARFSSPTIIREYPCEVQSPNAEDSTENSDYNLQSPIDKDTLVLVS